MRGTGMAGWAVALGIVVASCHAAPAAGQGQGELPATLLRQVMPAADRFSGKEGEPAVRRAFRSDPAGGTDRLVGYVFLTSEIPPQAMGYDAPIEVLVGMDLSGVITGVVVTNHRESLSRSRGDFFTTRGFQEQFGGKGIGDPFRIRRDLAGISGATISVDAMARGVRDSARRVALAYLDGPGTARSASAPISGSATLDDLRRSSWMELVNGGPVHRLAAVENGIVRVELFFTAIPDEEVGAFLLGDAPFREALERAGERREGRQLMMLGLDGSTVWFRPYLLSVAQDGDTIAVRGNEVILFEPSREGKVADQLRAAGLWLVDGGIDLTRPFTLLYGGGMGLQVVTGEYPGWRPEAATIAEAPAEQGEAVTAVVPPPPGPPPPAAPVHSTEATSAEPRPAGDPDRDAPAPESTALLSAAESASTAGAAAQEETGRPFEVPAVTSWAEALEVQDESRLSRTLGRTWWPRVVGLLLLLGLVSAAFIRKGGALRWVALASTLLLLGFLDGGFLSVSHITSAIAVGPGVYLNDLSLLILVVFTLVTTLLWGRLFCGYLCPFGALQDFIDRVTPRRLQRSLRQGVHRPLLKAKYLVLGALVVPAALGVEVGFFQYVEPFGTVFFRSPSMLLWVIALGFLGASVVVPRFYCRYVCPLGAGLALLSHVSPFRIRRVEQCTVCSRCERACPTGAIQGAEVDFPECVRCGVCETLLTERVGACGHDMEEIRPRLVQLGIRSR